MPIMIHGTISQCAAAMGIKETTFRSFASKQRNGGSHSGSSKYEIVRDDEDGCGTED